MDALTHDLRYAIRSLWRSRGFTVAAVITLALGIGATGAVFSLADATALRPPDVPNPSQIVRVFTSTQSAPYGEVSYPDYRDLQAGAKTVSGLVAYEHMAFALAKSRTESAQYIGGWAVSTNFFSVLDVEPRLGRGFREDDERTARAVAVISDRLWQRQFAGDAAVIGRAVMLSGAEFTIVGVAPQTFASTELYFHPDVFIPLTSLRHAQPSLGADVLERRGNEWLTVLGRLRPGARATQALAEFTVLADGIQRAHPDPGRPRTAVVLPELTARARVNMGDAQGAVIMLGLVGLLVVLACANVTNLVLARNAARTREIALRVALGAGRTHVMRQLLTESLLLATAGCGLGLLLAQGVLAYLSTAIVIPTALPLSIDLRLDGRVLTLAAAVSLATGLLIGLVPALQRRSTGLTAWLTRNGADGSIKRSRLRAALVVTQVTIAVLVLVAAGLLVQASLVAQRVDPGFRTEQVLLASFDPGIVRYDTAKAKGFYARLVEQTRALPGVRAVGLTRDVPFGINGPSSIGIVPDGATLPKGQDRILVADTQVDDGYWTVMGVPIVTGRAFDARDTLSSPLVAVVNETMARRYWPDGHAIGRTIRIPDVPTPSGPRPLVMEIVGVARDGKYSNLAEAPQPFVYRPIAQGRRIGALTMVVLADEPLAVAPSVRRAAAALDAAVPMFEMREMRNLYQLRALMPPRFMSQLTGAIGAIGVLLAAVGLYGVLALITARRTREFGVRLAVGAQTHSVVWLVLRQAAALVLPGLALGVLAAALLTPLIGSPAFDFVSPGDPFVFIMATLVAAISSLVAAALPARRASHVDPVVALRAE